MNDTYNVFYSILEELQAIHNIMEQPKKNEFLKKIRKASKNALLIDLFLNLKIL